jgi:hypothetical protein
MYNRSFVTDPGGTFMCPSSIDIIERENGLIGILLTEVQIEISYTNNKYIQTIKNQLSGKNQSFYYFLEDITKTQGMENYLCRSLYHDYNIPYINITASDCLIDPNIPLRYSLQNAFDGDPATSYVENTEDDLMELEFSGIYKLGYMNRIAIINGYAQNIMLYNSNNRIKKIKRGPDEVELRDDHISYQFLDTPVKPQFVIITDIFKGTRYNDTCIAELNLLTDEGWLFGEVNE